MKKKTISLTLLSFIFIILLSQISFAAFDLADTFKKTGVDKIFFDIFKADGTLGANGLLYLRVLLFLLVFALIFGVSEWVFKDFAKGNRVTIAIVIGLISTVALPKDLLILIATTYTTVFYLLIYIGIAVGGMYIAFTAFKGEESYHYFGKGFVLLVLWYITSGLITKGLQTAKGVTNLVPKTPEWAVFQGIIELFSVVLFFMGIYYLFKTFFGSKKTITQTYEDNSDAKKEAIDKIKNLFGHSVKRNKDLKDIDPENPEEAIKKLNQAKIPNAYKEIKKNINDVKEIMHNIIDLNEQKKAIKILTEIASLENLHLVEINKYKKKMNELYNTKESDKINELNRETIKIRNEMTKLEAATESRSQDLINFLQKTTNKLNHS